MITATADVFEQMGETGYLHADTVAGNRLTVEVRDRAFPALDSEVGLVFDPARAFIFDQDGKRTRSLLPASAMNA